MYRHILVVTQGDAPRQPALSRAFSSAPSDAAITVLDVVYEPALEGYLGDRERYEPLRRRVTAERQERLDALVARVGASRIQARAVWGHPRDETIEAEAAVAAADLVVTVPSGADGSLTSNDWRLVARCPVPVLIVRTDGQLPYRQIVAAVDPFHAHSKPAELDRTILAHALALQSTTGAELNALHCRLPLPPQAVGFGPSSVADEGADEATLRELLAESGVPPGAARVADGSPHAVLRTLAERGEADLIVMGVLARGRLRELIVGHTAERVLHGAGADVLVVK